MSSGLAICLPAHDERLSLEKLLPELAEAVREAGWTGTNVYIFDDGSRDDTESFVSGADFFALDIVLIRSNIQVGKARALHEAIKLALADGARTVVIMDADGQDDPAFLSPLVEAVAAGADVVNGRRVNRAHSAAKRISSRLFNGSVRGLTGLRLWDINSGLKAFSQRGAEVLQPYLYGELHRVVLIVAVWSGLRVAEYPVVNRPRTAGKSKYGLARGWRGLFDLVTIQFLRRYHSRPGHFFSGVGVTLIVLGLVVVAAGLGGSLAPGWPAGLSSLWVAGIIVTVFGGVFISFGFIAEMIVFLSKNPATSVLQVTREAPGKNNN